MRTLHTACRAGQSSAALQTGLSHYSRQGGALRVTAQTRRPLFGTVTVVGREEATTTTSFLASSVPKSSATLRLMHQLGLHPKPLLFDGHGVPVDGSMVVLPASEKLRLMVAMLLAFAATKLTYDVTRYECIYHNVWNTKWRYSTDVWRRTQYYVGFTAATLGLSSLYVATFLAAATIAGRQRLAARMVHRNAALVLPRRSATVLARRLHV